MDRMMTPEQLKSWIDFYEDEERRLEKKLKGSDGWNPTEQEALDRTALNIKRIELSVMRTIYTTTIPLKRNP